MSILGMLTILFWVEVSIICMDTDSSIFHVVWIFVLLVGANYALYIKNTKHTKTRQVGLYIFKYWVRTRFYAYSAIYYLSAKTLK